MAKAILSRPSQPAPKPVTPPPSEAHRWAMIEATNLLRCISIATDHGESVADELRPSIGVAIDGVVRLLSHVVNAQEVNHG